MDPSERLGWRQGHREVVVSHIFGYRWLKCSWLLFIELLEILSCCLSCASLGSVTCPLGTAWGTEGAVGDSFCLPSGAGPRAGRWEQLCFVQDKIQRQNSSGCYRELKEF